MMKTEPDTGQLAGLTAAPLVERLVDNDPAKYPHGVGPFYLNRRMVRNAKFRPHGTIWR